MRFKKFSEEMREFLLSDCQGKLLIILFGISIVVLILMCIWLAI